MRAGDKIYERTLEKYSLKVNDNNKKSSLESENFPKIRELVKHNNIGETKN